MTAYRTTRTIGIDAGHRIMTHGSKCRHLHGHRYTIEATCEGVGEDVQRSGEQTNMIVDFGFLKAEMLRHIDEPCDHGFILSAEDEEALAMLAPASYGIERWIGRIREEVLATGYCTTTECRLQTKLYVVAFQPTAECLARHWLERLAPAVRTRSNDLAEIRRVRVWETPNCWAEYYR